VGRKNCPEIMDDVRAELQGVVADGPVIVSCACQTFTVRRLRGRPCWSDQTKLEKRSCGEPEKLMFRRKLVQVLGGRRISHPHRIVKRACSPIRGDVRV